MAESGPRYLSLVAAAAGRPITGDSVLRLDVDSRLSGVTCRVDRLLIAAGLSASSVADPSGVQVASRRGR